VEKKFICSFSKFKRKFWCLKSGQQTHDFPFKKNNRIASFTNAENSPSLNINFPTLSRFHECDIPKYRIGFQFRSNLPDQFFSGHPKWSRYIELGFATCSLVFPGFVFVFYRLENFKWFDILKFLFIRTNFRVYPVSLPFPLAKKFEHGRCKTPSY